MDIDTLEIGREYALVIDSEMHTKPVTRRVIVTEVTAEEQRFFAPEVSTYVKTQDVESGRIRDVYTQNIISTWDEYLERYEKIMSEVREKQAEADDISKTMKDLEFPIDMKNITPRFDHDNLQERFSFSNEQMREIIEWAQQAKMESLGRIFK